MLAGIQFKPHTNALTCHSNRIKAAHVRSCVAAQKNRRILARSDQSIDKEELSQLLGEQFLRPQYDDYSDEHVRDLACAGSSSDSLTAAAAAATSTLS
jgi:hypothetical protein